MDTAIVVRVLGPLRVHGIEIPAARQQRAVLAALAAAHPSRLSPDHLIEGLWPTGPPKDAPKALQVLISRLRKRLSPVGVGVALESDGYVLEIDDRAIDARMFAVLCDEERQLPESLLGKREDHLEQALALFDGEPFADLVDEPLLEEFRRHLLMRREETMGRLHQVKLDLGQHETLVPALTAWAQSRPLDEAAWSRLAMALHRAGRPTEALRALHVHRQTVRGQAGIEPTTALTQLEAQLLADNDEPGPGHHRQGNLRPPRQPILGRSREIRELATLLEPGSVLSLTGPGGVGKTTLAVHLASGVTDRFRDGVWLCELAEIETGSAVPDAVASTLGVSQQRGQTLIESLVNGFRQAEALVIVDNCEHLRRPIADLVDVLVTNCSKLAVVATSRESLDLRSERSHQVKPLPVPDPDVTDPTGPAIELFLDRARRSGADLDADRETRVVIAEICRRLDGIPLAIELAASRTRSMSVTEMSVRLDERFRILDQNRQDSPRRHRTLWDTVDWSYQLLDSDEQDLLNRLSVFLGGFTLEAASAVAGVRTDTEAAVWSLVDRSLVQPGSGADGITRYQMLETLRQYGSERLSRAGNETETRNAHLEYYTDFATRADQGIRGPDEASSVRRLTDELANLRSAHHHAITTKQFDLAAQLIGALHDYAIWRQFFELGSWAEATLELGAAPTPRHPVLLATAGWGRCIAGHYERAIRFAEAGLELESLVDHQCGWLHDILAHCAYFQGDHETGLAHGDAEIRRARAASDAYRLSYVLADSGTHASLVDQHETGMARANEAHDLALQIGNPSAISMAQLATGFAYRDHSPVEAIAWLQQAAKLADTIDSRWTAAICRGELALLLSLHGDPHEAIHLALDQFLTFRRAGDAGRVRGVVRMAIPALHQLLGREHHVDLITIDCGTSDRPHIREPFNDKAIAEVITQITSTVDPSRADAASARGRALTDDAVFDLALQLMKTATGESPSDDQ